MINASCKRFGHIRHPIRENPKICGGIERSDDDFVGGVLRHDYAPGGGNLPRDCLDCRLACVADVKIVNGGAAAPVTSDLPGRDVISDRAGVIALDDHGPRFDVDHGRSADGLGGAELREVQNSVAADVHVARPGRPAEAELPRDVDGAAVDIEGANGGREKPDPKVTSAVQLAAGLHDRSGSAIISDRRP
jgi:hypothetical protein